MDGEGVKIRGKTVEMEKMAISRGKKRGQGPGFPKPVYGGAGVKYGSAE